jgi:phage anti-repressor protein
MTHERLDIVQLIENNPLEKLSNHYQTELLDRIKETFNDSDQQLFISSFYCYLKYDCKTDFIINMDDVWKWLGFSRKDPCKRIIEKHFTNHTDYKILLHNSVEQVHGGQNKEKIVMNVETFKSLCLLANTERSKSVRKYYYKLEQLLHGLLEEQANELKNRLEEKNKQLEEQEKTIRLLENKPETEGFCSKNGYIYLLKDTSSIGSYKIGLCENPNIRLTTLNISSSQKSLEMIGVFKCNNMKSAEKTIHVILDPFRIKKRNEWFYFPNDHEVNYAVHIIKKSIQITNNYDFLDYNSFKNYAENLPIEEIDKEYKPEKYTNANFIKRTGKLSQYNGVSWCIKNNKWASRIGYDNKTIFLGIYTTEDEAAVVYNDYAIYLNKTVNTNYQLNEIEDYTPNPRDIPEENYKNKYENKTSSFNGVYFIRSKGIFEASIQYKKKSFKLIKNECDIECAKVYNEQALYFNTHFKTNYKLNDISDFITVEKNHISELEITKKQRYSRFTGVTIRNDSGKFRAYIKYNRKVINCGTFKDEIDAARSYNLKAEELNKLETTKIKYELNNLEL